MTDQEIRTAIAEACGLIKWRTEDEYQKLVSEWEREEEHPHASLTKPTRAEYKRFPLPDYLNDSNAMREAEEALSAIEPPDGNCQRDFYALELLKIVGTWRKEGYHWGDVCDYDFFKVAHATARQRAEAFLRTIGKWL